MGLCPGFRMCVGLLSLFKKNTCISPPNLGSVLEAMTVSSSISNFTNMPATQPCAPPPPTHQPSETEAMPCGLALCTWEEREVYASSRQRTRFLCSQPSCSARVLIFALPSSVAATSFTNLLHSFVVLRSLTLTSGYLSCRQRSMSIRFSRIAWYVERSCMVLYRAKSFILMSASLSSKRASNCFSRFSNCFSSFSNCCSNCALCSFKRSSLSFKRSSLSVKRASNCSLIILSTDPSSSEGRAVLCRVAVMLTKAAWAGRRWVVPRGRAAGASR
mmetsp:Transcript_18032/g.52605  ORF Transcript_18032/g.52605 Transcript_18032/m.52605 type:complete len:274 (-) Transcript_18032:69-890(-)